MSRILEDIQTVIFDKYVQVIEDAIIDQDVPTLLNVWHQATKLGSRGVILKTLINKGANDIIDVWRKEIHPRVLYLVPPTGPYNVRILENAYQARLLVQAVQDKDFALIERIIEKDPLYASLFRNMMRRKFPTPPDANFLYFYLRAQIVIDKSKVKFVRRIGYLGRIIDATAKEDYEPLLRELAEIINIKEDHDVVDVFMQEVHNSEYKKALRKYLQI